MNCPRGKSVELKVDSWLPMVGGGGKEYEECLLMDMGFLFEMMIMF